MASNKIRIPTNDKEAIFQIFELSSDERDSIIESISKVKPEYERSRIVNYLTDATSIEESKIQKVVDFLTSLYFASEYIGLSLNEIAHEVIVESKGYDEIDFDKKNDEYLKNIEQFIEECLNQPVFKLGAKSRRVKTQHQKIYSKSELFTDIRPIFKSNDSDLNPEAAVIVHSLKLTYTENGDKKNIFLALDQNDLNELTETLNRATVKYKKLSKFINSSSIHFIEIGDNS